MTAAPIRRVAVWCPDWPIVAAGIEPTVPAAVIAADRVVASSPAAASRGVVGGMRRRTAQQRCPDLTLVDDDPDRDGRAFERVARAIGRLTPLLEVVEPGWVCLDARGPSRCFGGDAAFADRVVSEVADRTGARVQVGVADGRFAAAVASRRARAAPVVIRPGGSPEFLAPLPVGWLHRLGEVDAELVELLARLGLARLGDVAALDVTHLLGRFGAIGAHAHRLAAGHDLRPTRAAPPPPDRQVTHTFDGPVESVEPLVFAGKRLAHQLATSLAAEGTACVRLAVTAETDHGERDARTWYRSTGFSAAAMTERVRWQLAAWIATGEPTAGVTLLRLQPIELRRDDGEQPGLWGGHSDHDLRAHRALARLAGMLGDHAVLVPAWHGGRMPDDRYRWVPASTVDLDDPIATARRLGPGPAEGPWPGALPSPAPATVHAESIPAVVADRLGRPLHVTGRGELTGEPGTVAIGTAAPRPIAAWAGPWPVDDHWWDPTRRRRVARLQLVTDAGDAHLALTEQRRWWITASYD